eukprot:359188-Chlamydomonas_euryale.AAC.4
MRSTPSCRTISSRRVRMCFRSFSVKFDGTSLLFGRSCAGDARDRKPTLQGRRRACNAALHEKALISQRASPQACT